MGLKETLTELAKELIDASDAEPKTMTKTLLCIGSKLEGIALGLPDQSSLGWRQNKEQETHQSLMEAAVREARMNKAKANAQHQVEPRLVACVDGPQEGVFAPVHPDMPLGAFTNVGGSVYELKADGLYLDRRDK